MTETDMSRAGMTERLSAFAASTRRFLASPAGGASALLLASLAGLGLANSPWAAGYATLTALPLSLSFLGGKGPGTLAA